jgi:hypothetical protein
VDKNGAPVGSNFGIGSGYAPAVCASASGNFVVVWGSSTGIYGRRLDGGGNPVGPEFLASPVSSGPHFDVGCDAQGGFVVVWDEVSLGEVWGQRFDRNAAAIGPVFQVNSYSPGLQLAPKVAVGPSGNFVVTRTDLRNDIEGDVYARRFDNRGRPLGQDVLVNTYTRDQQGFSTGGKGIGIDSDGNFVIVWNSFPGQDGSSDGVFGQRFDWHGHKLGREFQANTFTNGGQWPVTVASDQEGNFLVTWRGGGIYGQLYGPTGRQIGSEFHINTLGGSLDFPAVSAGADGRFLVAWNGPGAQRVSSQALRVQDHGDCRHH